MNYTDAVRRLEELFRRKLAEQRTEVSTRDQARVDRGEILEAVLELGEEDAIALAEAVLSPPEWYVVDSLYSAERGLLAIWFTDASGWRRLQGS